MNVRNGLLAFLVVALCAIGVSAATHQNDAQNLNGTTWIGNNSASIATIAANGSNAIVAVKEVDTIKKSVEVGANPEITGMALNVANGNTDAAAKPNAINLSGSDVIEVTARNAVNR